MDRGPPRQLPRSPRCLPEKAYGPGDVHAVGTAAPPSPSQVALQATAPRAHAEWLALVAKALVEFP